MRKTSTPRPTHDFPRVRAELSASALRRSFLAIVNQLGGNQRGVLPMVKANAYGHGVQWVVRELLALKSGRLEGFGVASLEEGAELRNGALAKHPAVRVLCFSGATPWTEEKRRFCMRFGLTPVLSREEDFRRFSRRGGGIGELEYELKFDTGMHRLGIPIEAAPKLAAEISRRPGDEQPRGVLSHLAISENPGALLTRTQIKRFAGLRELFAGTSACFHLSNSGAIWNERELGLADLTDFVRPGISLYGVPPWPGAPARGIKPVMRVSAQIIDVKKLAAGESVGYGATFTAPVGGTEIAVLSAGYADGVKRILSNAGQARLGHERLQFLGIVSMDLSVVGAVAGAARGRRAKGGSLKSGQWVDILGGGIDPWEQARAAGTIPYELLTSWSSRVERTYR